MTLARAVVIGLLLVAGFSLISVGLLFGAAYGFTTKGITAPNDSAPGVAVDQGGNLYFSHSVQYKLYNSDQGLYCTSNVDGEWTTLRITDNQSVDSTSLEVDEDSHLHIAYTYDLDLSTNSPSVSVEGYVGYATNQSGEWRTYIVAQGYGIYRQCQIALTSEGSPGILFIVSGTLKFAWALNDTNPVFSVEEVTDGVLAADLDFDDEGAPHVSYVSDETLIVATRVTPGVWNATSVFSNHVSSIHTSLGYDGDGWGRVSFFSSPDGVGGLFYANESGGIWRSERLLNATDTDPAFCKLVIDSENRVHIGSSFDDHLALYSREQGHGWVNYYLVGGSPASIEMSVSSAGHVILAPGSFIGEIQYLTDDASATEVAMQVPYIMPVGIALVAIAAILVVLEVLRYFRSSNSRTGRSG